MKYSLDFRRWVFEIKERDKLAFEETSKRFRYINAYTVALATTDGAKNQT